MATHHPTASRSFRLHAHRGRRRDDDPDRRPPRHGAGVLRGHAPHVHLVGEPHRPREGPRGRRERPHRARHAHHHVGADQERRERRRVPRRGAAPLRAPAPTAWSIPPTTRRRASRCCATRCPTGSSATATTGASRSRRFTRQIEIVELSPVNPDLRELRGHHHLHASGRRRGSYTLRTVHLRVLVENTMRDTPTPSPARAGFSLVELMVAMAIVLIVMGGDDDGADRRLPGQRHRAQHRSTSTTTSGSASTWSSAT